MSVINCWIAVIQYTYRKYGVISVYAEREVVIRNAVDRDSVWDEAYRKAAKEAWKYRDNKELKLVSPISIREISYGNSGNLRDTRKLWMKKLK